MWWLIPVVGCAANAAILATGTGNWSNVFAVVVCGFIALYMIWEN